MRQIISFISITLLVSIAFVPSSLSQSYSQFGVQYEKRANLIHPSLLGEVEDYTVHFLAYNANWQVVGQPLIASFVAAVPVTDKLVLGLNLLRDLRGAFLSYRLLGSVAYRLELNENSNLLFGASLGTFSSKLVNTQGVNIGIDRLLATYNTSRSGFFDGDIGVSYVGNNNLKLSLSLVNLKKYISDVPIADQQGLVNFAAQYDFALDGSSNVVLTPLAHLRMFDGRPNQLDFGVNVELLQKFGFLTVYKTTTNSFVGGLSVSQKNVEIFGAYHLWLGAIRSDLGGAFELSVAFMLEKPKRQ